MASDLEALAALGQRVVDLAKRGGADVAEATVRDGFQLSAKVRAREPELIEEAGSKALGLRVLIGKQVGVSYTSDLTDGGVARFVDDAIELAKLSEPDEFIEVPDRSQLANGSASKELGLYDDAVDGLDAAKAIEMAKAAEEAAYGFDPRVTNSEGATVARITGGVLLVTSEGFSGGYDGTNASVVVRPVADDTDGKKRSGFHWSSRRYLGDLESPAEIGKEAAQRTLKKLGAQKVDTQQAPVVFDPEAGRSVIGLFCGSVLGNAIWRRASYLVDREETKVASDLVTMVDDPLIPRAPGSRPFDGEGLASRKNVVVERGVLKTYLMDMYAAKKLGRETTASAARVATGGVGPSSSNFILEPGSMTPEALIQDTGKGLYVTEMMGFGFNPATGDFSRGASGFWIEGGELTYPVSEVTISLNLDELLKSIDAVANDLDLRAPTATPTFRVASMTVAGRS